MIKIGRLVELAKLQECSLCLMLRPTTLQPQACQHAAHAVSTSGSSSITTMSLPRPDRCCPASANAVRSSPPAARVKAQRRRNASPCRPARPARSDDRADCTADQRSRGQGPIRRDGRLLFRAESQIELTEDVAPLILGNADPCVPVLQGSSAHGAAPAADKTPPWTV